jgi:hypothetical protein
MSVPPLTIPVMDDGGHPDLFPELGPPGPGAAWWEVSAAFPDGEAPWPPPSYPPEAGVVAVHTARMTTLMVRAGSGSQALARAEGLLRLASAEWRVRPAPASEASLGGPPLAKVSA